MKFNYLPIAIAVTISISSCSVFKKNEKAKTETAPQPVALTELQKSSYTLGSMMAADLKRNGIDTIDADYVAKAFYDVLVKDTSIISDFEKQMILRELSQNIQQKQAEKAQKENAKVIAEGNNFLATNSKNVGVITTPSGLQYKITKVGSGAYPKATDQVQVHYEGKLLNGQIFDSSFERGQPAAFGLNQVIPGWTEGLQHINEGGEIELYIPYFLAYGEQGAGGAIPPYATLVFKVQLIKVEAAQTMPEGHGIGDGHNH